MSSEFRDYLPQQEGIVQDCKIGDAIVVPFDEAIEYDDEEEESEKEEAPVEQPKDSESDEESEEDEDQEMAEPNAASAEEPTQR